MAEAWCVVQQGAPRLLSGGGVPEVEGIAVSDADGGGIERCSVLRTDLARWLGRVRLLLVGAAPSMFEGEDGDGTAAAGALRAALGALRTAGVEVRFIGDGRPLATGEAVGVFAAHGLEVIPFPSGDGVESYYERLKAECGLEDGEVAVLAASSHDLPLVRRAAFSASPASAPLEVRAEVDYASPQSGLASVVEIARLIARARAAIRG